MSIRADSTPRTTSRAPRAEDFHGRRLLLPDGWAGQSISIQVDGIRGGQRVASGLVDVVPRLAREVGARVVLAEGVCEAWCSPGEKECLGDGVVACQAGDGGCAEWSQPMACAAETPYCSLGECRTDCADECAAGETVCAGPAAVRTCGQADGDDCMDWLAPVPCGGGETCSAGTCGPGCTDACENAGDTVCPGPGTATCGDYNRDGCLRPAAEAASLEKAADRAHRRAASALYVAAVLAGHFLIGFEPARARPDRHGRQRPRRRAAARDECIVHGDAPHTMGPIATAFHHSHDRCCRSSIALPWPRRSSFVTRAGSCHTRRQRGAVAQDAQRP